MPFPSLSPFHNIPAGNVGASRRALLRRQAPKKGKLQQRHSGMLD